jgi:hypothetical protein
MAGKKKFFPTTSGKYPSGGGKKPNSKTQDNCTGHCSIIHCKGVETLWPNEFLLGAIFFPPLCQLAACS